MLNISRQLLVGLLLLMAWQAQAETVWINDTLRVGVRPEPTNSVSPIGVVVTGTKLEVLERRGDHLRIRTDNGLEGWIKASYTRQNPPAQIQLESLRKEFDALKQRSSKYDEVIRNTEAANKVLRQELDKIRDSNTELQLAMARAQQGQDDSTSVWEISTYILLGLLGFFIGVIWHRYQAMKKLGGLRV